MSPCYLRTSMASQAQIEANRRNSQKSTGPVSAAGKASSSLNALKTGVYAESLLIHGEAADTLDDLARDYQATCRPVGPREQAAVNTLIHSDWLLRRMRRVETLLWKDEGDKWRKAGYRDADPEDAPLITWQLGEERFLRIQRRLTALDRAYHRALVDLERLQSKRLSAAGRPSAELPTPEIGFVPSPATIVVDSNPPGPSPALPAARFSPTLGHFPQPKPLQKTTGAENLHIKRPPATI